MYLFADPQEQPQEQETKTFTPDLAGLIAWLETQDPETKYNPCSASDCLLSRFANAQSGEQLIDPFGKVFNMFETSEYWASRQIAYAHIFGGEPTYQGALTRARALGRVGR